MKQGSTILVFGATGQTGRHFVSLALDAEQKIRALVRNPAKLPNRSENVECYQGSITDFSEFNQLLDGVDFVVAMLGDAEAQRHSKVNTAFVKRLVPAMRRSNVTRFLYQAGGLSKPYKKELPPLFWTLRNTIARGFIGQHEDNEAVMTYLEEEARDIQWIVHRAGIGSNSASKGTLIRSNTKFSIATFADCASYNYRTLTDEAAVHTSDLSCYLKP